MPPHHHAQQDLADTADLTHLTHHSYVVQLAHNLPPTLMDLTGLHYIVMQCEIIQDEFQHLIQEILPLKNEPTPK